MVKKAAPLEVKYDVCNGTGFPPVIKPARPGRKIYPPLCNVCGGKGRIRAQATKDRKKR
jgi:hypothetical protein